jgi:hypothetical protein
VQHPADAFAELLHSPGRVDLAAPDERVEAH